MKFNGKAGLALAVVLAVLAGVLLFAMGLFKPLIPARYRAVKPEAIARALLEGVVAGQPGERIVESEKLQ